MLFKITLIVFIIAVIVAVLFVIPTTPNYWVTTGKREIYYVELPVGKFWTDIEGHFIFASGTIDSRLTESFPVKYFKGNELRSLMLDASSTPIIPDGQFYLEIRRWAFKNVYGMEVFHGIEYFAIHVPALPNLNETLKWNLP